MLDFNHREANHSDGRLNPCMIKCGRQIALGRQRVRDGRSAGDLTWREVPQLREGSVRPALVML